MDEQQGLNSVRAALRSPDLKYSLRRYYVDEFHFRHIAQIEAGSKVLDVGGNRGDKKRGKFDLTKYDLDSLCVNISEQANPDLVADAANLPLENEKFDAAICSELLEHVPDPQAVLSEVCRVLKKNGVLFICVPFLFRIHADPYDYGRYTDYYWQQRLTAAGFTQIEIEKQGLYWSVLVDMIRDLSYQMSVQGKPRSKILRRLIAKLVAWGRLKALSWDKKAVSSPHLSLKDYTTGFGIVARK